MDNITLWTNKSMTFDKSCFMKFTIDYIKANSTFYWDYKDEIDKNCVWNLLWI
jgi:hypothetical protein